jgi:hypothetical protein
MSERRKILGGRVGTGLRPAWRRVSETNWVAIAVHPVFLAASAIGFILLVGWGFQGMVTRGLDDGALVNSVEVMPSQAPAPEVGASEWVLVPGVGKSFVTYRGIVDDVQELPPNPRGWDMYCVRGFGLFVFVPGVNRWVDP